MTKWRVLLALTSFLATFLVLEMAAYLVPLPAGAFDPGVWRWRKSSAELGWRLRPGFRGEVYDAWRVVAKTGLFELDSRQLGAEPDLPLVLALGDSRTFGNGVALEATWAEQLDRRLAGAAVINLGVPGYSLVQGVKLLEKELEQRHGRVAVAVLAFGFNDRRYAAQDGPDDGTVFARRARSVWWRSVIGRSRVVRQLQGRWWKRTLQRPLDLRTRQPRVSLERFRAELHRAVELCAAKGVALVLLALPDNPGMAGELEAGEAAVEAGDLTAAVAALSAGVARDNVFSDAARLALARVLRMDGAPGGGAGAAEAVVWSNRRLESESGGYPLASFRGYRSAMSVEGAVLLDVGEALARPEMFFDFVHFRPEGHEVVAELLAPLVAEALAPVGEEVMP